MSPWALWLSMILLIGAGIAADVPFVFDETSSDVASYNSDQIEQAHISSPDLAGVPIVSSPSDTEILAFPVTGGGSTPEEATDKKVGELKESLSARVEPDNSVVRHEAVVLAAKYPGDRTIDQISSIYNYLKNGADSKKGWSYVADTRGIDNFMYANETLEIGKDAGCVGAGDCDDFAILMAALVESIGGTTRIILARNNTTGGHAYTEVYLGNLDASNSQVENIISWLKEKFDTDKIYTHIDTATKDVWLNLDWGPDEKGNTHPGGPFYQGDKHIVLSIRDTFVKTPLKLPEKSNKPPKLASLIPDKPSPQDAGTAVTWTAEAKDPENDQILYRFFLNDDPVTKWAKENKWVWTTTEDDLGDSQIEIQVQDGKHAGPDKYDANKVASFIIYAPQSVPLVSTDQPNLAEDWNNKGLDLYRLAYYEEAVKAYEEAIRLDPKFAQAWCNKGLALNQMRKYDEAIEACDEAIKLDPMLALAWNFKGLVLANQGKNEEAIKAYEEADRILASLVL